MILATRNVRPANFGDIPLEQGLRPTRDSVNCLTGNFGDIPLEQGLRLSPILVSTHDT